MNVGKITRRVDVLDPHAGRGKACKAEVELVDQTGDVRRRPVAFDGGAVGSGIIGEARTSEPMRKGSSSEEKKAEIRAMSSSAMMYVDGSRARGYVRERFRRRRRRCVEKGRQKERR